MEKRYRALRIIGTVYKAFGIIVGILTVIGDIGFCLMAVAGGSVFSRMGASTQMGALMGGALSGLVVGIIGLIYGGALALGLYGLGEGIYLAISIEENTRATVRLLEQQSRPPQHPGV